MNKEITNIQYFTAPTAGWKGTSILNVQKPRLAFSIGDNWVRQSTFIQRNGEKIFVSIEVDGKYKDYTVEIRKLVERYEDGSEYFEAKLV